METIAKDLALVGEAGDASIAEGANANDTMAWTMWKVVTTEVVQKSLENDDHQAPAGGMIGHELLVII